MTPAGIVVIDVGSSSVRATVVDETGAIAEPCSLPTPPVRSPSGTVEIDVDHLWRSTLAVAERAISNAPTPPDALAITNQRASTVLFRRGSGAPIGNGLSWQDVRTAGHCLALRSRGVSIQPSQSATKVAAMLATVPGDRDDVLFGTLETYLVYRLSEAMVHTTDASNAGVTGMVTADGSSWDRSVLEIVGVPESVLPEIVDSTAAVGRASVLSGAPVICGLLGDQQASLIGQGCLRAGDAKITFGTGGMLDLCSGERSEPPRRGAQGTFPIVAWRDRSRTVFGREGVILSAGSAVDLLVSGLGVLDSAASSEEVARSTRDSAGLVFVPALGGFGTPLWDHGARGALLGVHNGTTRAEVVRAVLEGIAHRGRDLLDAVEADEGVTIDELGIDGGMSSNSLFVQIVANAMGRPLRKSGSIEATTIGAAMVGGVGYGLWDSLESAAAIIPVAERVEPDGSLDRSRWLELREHALRTVPALSMLTF